MSVIRGTRATDLVSSSLIKREVYEAIFNFKPYQTPITQFFMANNAGKYGTGNPKIELQEDILFPHSDVLAAAITGGSATEACTLTNGGYFKVGTLVRNTVANENYRVTVVSGNTITFSTLDGTSLMTATPNGSTILIIGSAYAEGAAQAQALSTVSTFPYNYLGIQKKAVSLTGTQQATVNYGGSDWTNQRVKATEEFKLDLERSWVYGVRAIATTSGANVRHSGGLLDSASIGISDVSQFVGNDFAGEDFFFKTYCKGLFAKGSNRKTLYCGSDAILGIGEYSKVKQKTQVTEKEYGYDIQTILTPFGMLDLVWHPLLEGAYSNWAIGVDRINFMKYAFLNGNGISRDMQYQDNIQTPGTDIRSAQYLAEVGLHLAGGSQGVHRVLYPGA